MRADSAAGKEELNWFFPQVSGDEKSRLEWRIPYKPGRVGDGMRFQKVWRWCESRKSPTFEPIYRTPGNSHFQYMAPSRRPTTASMESVAASGANTSQAEQAKYTAPPSRQAEA